MNIDLQFATYFKLYKFLEINLKKKLEVQY
jgi:hypothetical protein